MTEKPRRPILHLKFPPAAPIVTPAAAPVAATVSSAPKAATWKCKPCGKAFQVAAELADDEAVRCPACNARLGLAGDFRGETPNLERIRARPVAEPKPARAAPAHIVLRKGR
jgi:DNA-directed RNA polymerase subunit RPC12/RpoP